MKQFLLASIAAIFMAAYAVAGVPATKVHKPTGDKIQVESAGEIELKSGALLDLQAGSTTTVAGAANLASATVTPPTPGWPLPTVDIAVTTPSVAGLLVKTSASLVYVSTAAVGVANWIKVGAQ